jgi:hypothetical protein
MVMKTRSFFMPWQLKGTGKMSFAKLLIVMAEWSLTIKKKVPFLSRIQKKAWLFSGYIYAVQSE